MKGNQLPFSFTAITGGQTIFSPLPVLAGQVFKIEWLAVQGVVQDVLNGDYTLSGNQITLITGIASGQRVFGVIKL